MKYTKFDLINFAKEHNLILKSSYSEYINVDAPLKWKCSDLDCGHEFSQTVSNIKKAKIPCEKCRKSKQFNQEQIIHELTEDNITIISNNKWNLMKKILWFAIDAYVKRIVINGDITTETVKNMVQMTLRHLIEDYKAIDKFSVEKVKTIRQSIVTIFLLRKCASLSQNKIVEIVGYSSSKPVKQIRECLKIPLPKHGIKLVYDDKKKELRNCRICGKKKRYSEYRKNSKGKLRRECKTCENKFRALRRHEKKLLTALFVSLKHKYIITPQVFLTGVDQEIKFDVDVRCFDCGLGVEWLPVFQFDHILPILKTVDWKKLRDKNLREIIYTIDKEGCELRCANCHTMREAYKFNQFKGDIFTEKIRAEIYEDIRAIRNYIKKKILIIEFSNGLCPYCGVDINLLPTFEIHHPYPELKENSWANLRFYEIDEIRRIITREKCIWICGNCHELIKDINFSKIRDQLFRKWI